MNLSNRKSYVLHAFSSFMYLLEGVAVFGEATLKLDLIGQLAQ